LLDKPYLLKYRIQKSNYVTIIETIGIKHLSQDGMSINSAILYAASPCKPDIFMMMGGNHAMPNTAAIHRYGGLRILKLGETVIA
jgi:hypothetical protein